MNTQEKLQMPAEGRFDVIKSERLLDSENEGSRLRSSHKNGNHIVQSTVPIIPNAINFGIFEHVI